jgi:hypothetical protein
MKRICANIFVNTSRGIVEPNMEIINEYKIAEKGLKYNKIKLELETPFNYPDKIIQYKLEQIAKIYTLVLSKFESNLEFGCPYFTLDWKNKNVQSNAEITFANNCIEVHEGLELDRQIIDKRVHVINLDELNSMYDDNYLENEYNNLLLDNYYSASVVDKPQSKFFYLFIIFECYERNNFFKEKFNERLFSNDEIDALINTLNRNSVNYERKRTIIQEYRNRTLKTRSEKFYEYLCHRNIDLIKNNIIVSTDIKNIIDQRNYLFHSSSKFNNEILYKKLFPIIQKLLLEDLLNNQNIA